MTFVTYRTSPTLFSQIDGTYEKPSRLLKEKEKRFPSVKERIQRKSLVLCQSEVVLRGNKNFFAADDSGGLIFFVVQREKYDPDSPKQFYKRFDTQ